MSLVSLLLYSPAVDAKLPEESTPRETIIVAETCMPWDGKGSSLTINFADGRKFTASFWGERRGNLVRGETIVEPAHAPSLYHDSSGRTGETQLCEPGGVCKPAKLEMKLPLEDGVETTVTINGEVIPVITSYDKRTVICG